MGIRFSRNLAVLLGIITPALETIRRWHTWQEDPMSFFDDYILGGLLLLGAWRVTTDEVKGQKFLILGWGFAAGLAYASVDFQIQQFRLGAVDPAPVSSGMVLAIKLIGAGLIILGLLTGLRNVEQH